MNDNIRTMLDRTDKSYSGCIIDDQRYSRIVGNLCDSRKVRDIQFRVADGFCIDCPGLWSDRFLKCLRVRGFDKDNLPAKFRECVVEELVRAAVQIVSSYDLVTRPGYVQERIGNRCLS